MVTGMKACGVEIIMMNIFIATTTATTRTTMDGDMVMAISVSGSVFKL